MKSSMAMIVGILLIVFGIGVLGYKGFTYTEKEQVAKIGDVEITANSEKKVYFPPIVGAGALIAGIVLVIVGRKK